MHCETLALATVQLESLENVEPKTQPIAVGLMYYCNDMSI